MTEREISREREIRPKAAARLGGEKKPLCCAAGSCADSSGEIQIAS